MSESEFEVFVNEDVRGDAVAILLKGSSIVVDEDGELVPIMEMTPAVARGLACALEECAQRIEADKNV